MILKEQSLPQPFWSPEHWPKPESLSTGTTWLLPLELIVSVGGPFGTHFNELSAQSAVFRLDLRHFRKASDEVRRLAVESWLGRFQSNPVVIEGGAEKDLLEIFPRFSVKSLLLGNSLDLPEKPAAQAWIEAIAPEFFNLDGEEALKLLKSYSRELPEAESFPWEGLRFFGGFLRRKNRAGLGLIFQRAWQRAHALHSPQDEILEQKSLRRDEVMLNPTLQVFRSSEIELFWRTAGLLSELTIEIADAAIIDVLTESGRLEEERTIQEAALHSGLPRDALTDALSRLVMCGAILNSSQS